jgi:hypothetical protein
MVICAPTFALALRFQIEPPPNQPLLKRLLEEKGGSIDEVPLLKLRAAPTVAALCREPALKLDGIAKKSLLPFATIPLLRPY